MIKKLEWANGMHHIVFVGLVGAALAKEGGMPSVYGLFSGASKVSLFLVNYLFSMFKFVYACIYTDNKSFY